MPLEGRTEQIADESVERLGADAPPGHLVARVVAIAAAWTALHVTVVGLLLAPVVPGGGWTFLLLLALVVAAMVVMFRGFRTRVYPSAAKRLLVFRPFWYAEISIFFLSVFGFLGFLAGLPFGRGAAWGRIAILVVAALLLLLFVAGYVGSRSLVVRRIAFAFPDLPEAFDGLTIVQLSDLHVGPHTSRRFLSRVARAVADAKPDIVAHTGDQVDDFGEDVTNFVRAMGGLSAPLGVYAICGNHDVYAGWGQVRHGLAAAGIQVLVNTAVPVERNGARLWIAGTGDPAAAMTFVSRARDAAPDIERTLAQVPQSAFTVALAHNPALWPALAKRGVHLTLSGHTHHGQISIPPLRWCLASTFLPFAMGAYRSGRSVLYVHPGTNYWGLPLRIGAWPEVAVVTLRRAAWGDGTL